MTLHHEQAHTMLGPQRSPDSFEPLISIFVEESEETVVECLLCRRLGLFGFLIRSHELSDLAIIVTSDFLTFSQAPQPNARLTAVPPCFAQLLGTDLAELAGTWIW